MVTRESPTTAGNSLAFRKTLVVAGAFMSPLTPFLQLIARKNGIIKPTDAMGVEREDFCWSTEIAASAAAAPGLTTFTSGLTTLAPERRGFNCSEVISVGFCQSNGRPVLHVIPNALLNGSE